MPTQFQITVNTTRDFAETLSDDFFELGALSVTMTDAEDEPLFEIDLKEKPLWQNMIITALFDQTISAKKIILKIKNINPAYQLLNFQSETIAEKNWVAESQQYFHAQQFGENLWVCPEWEKENFKLPDNNKAIFIEPGLAFGTGTHPTTQLCLEYISNHPPKNKLVIDYGCGSGILALAAIALGAQKVFATDHDILALESTHNNASYNLFDKNNLIILKTNEINNTQADLMLANILANPLIELAPILTNLILPNGILILSGMLINDTDRVFAAYHNNFELERTAEKDGWALMELRKRAK